jgi:K+-transporting ATPase ATPase C chain
MLRELRSASIVFAVLTVITGVVYPAVVTALGRTLFADSAGGSLIEVGGRVVGSRLVGQEIASPAYFWSRPSATSPVPYNGGASSGSNRGPLNPALREAVAQRVTALRAADPGNTAPVPIDLVTASASGLDPHISVAAAQFQTARVARARGLAEADVSKLVREHTHGRTFGILGEPRVNVLTLNLALDAMSATPSANP